MSDAAAANPPTDTTPAPGTGDSATPAAGAAGPAATPTGTTEPANAFAAALALVPTKADAPAVTTPGADPWAGVPEKHRVFTGEGDARTLDAQATLAKVAHAYTSLESKLGAPAPASAAEYKLNLSEEVAAVLPAETLAANPGFQEFMGKMHAAGFSQAQVDVAVQELVTQGLALQETRAQATFDQCRSALQEHWTTDADFNANLGNFARALTTFAGQEGAATLGERYGNDPDFVRLMAMVGRELGEDQGHPTLQPVMSETDLAKLMVAGGPYWTPTHPEHEHYKAQVAAYHERTAGKAPRNASHVQVFELGHKPAA